ncbi:hypothetical protein HDU84_005106 [Entophlyctis sp. JEL0112]|nr:hypothetical protein HDU84_005106 [Entophlyctis sp. JEL0112]
MRVRYPDGSAKEFSAGRATTEDPSNGTVLENRPAESPDGNINGGLFDIAFNQWVPYDCHSTPRLLKNDHKTSPVTLSLTTWNVWFEPLFAKERYAALVEEALAKNSSVMCFQEVTMAFLDVLLANPTIREKFWVSQLSIPPRSFYTCIIAANIENFAVISHSCTEVYSKMGRCLWMAELQPVGFPSRVVRVMTAHFESLSSGFVTRESQRQVAKTVLLKNLNSAINYDLILCGDFNTTDEREDSQISSLGFMDVFDVLNMKTVSEGHTFGITWKSEFPPRRFDRIVLLSSPNQTVKGLVPRDYEEIGRSPIGELTCSDGRVYPSDHLGVFVMLSDK